MKALTGAALAAALASTLFAGVARAQEAPETKPATAPATDAAPASPPQEQVDEKKGEAADDPRGCNNAIVCELYFGVGVGLTQNLGGARAASANPIALPNDGGVFVQIEESQDTDIRVLFETHYLLQNQGVRQRTTATNDGDAAEWRDLGDIIPAIAACGPFAFVTVPESQRRGCGPFFAVSLDSDAAVAEFGMGWAIGFGKEGGANNFGAGIGVMIDPDSQRIDGRVVDTRTMLVRPEFETLVQAGEVELITRRTTTSLLIMISKTF